MEFSDFYRAIWKRLWLVVLCCAIGVGVTYEVGIRQPPVYTTTTTLAMNPEAAGALLPYQTSNNTAEIAANYSQYMKTYSFAALVADAVSPPISPDLVLRAVSVQFVTGTQFFRISASASSPELAQQIANSTARVFVQETANRQRARQEQLDLQRSQTITSSIGLGQGSTQQLLADRIRRNKDQIVSLQQRITELETQPATDARTREVLGLRQQIFELENLNMQAMTALTDAESSRIKAGDASMFDSVVVVDEAPLPTRPVTSDLLRNMLYAFTASLAFGLSGVYLFESMGYTFKTSEELDRAYGLPTLGLIFDATSELSKQTEASHVLSAAPRSQVAEAFRTLRTNVQFASVGRPLRTILVTSAVPAEGKSTVAMNLAIGLAQIGKRVVLIDADLRRPSLHRSFGRLNDQGLSTLALEPEADPMDSLKRTDVPGLSLLLAGPTPPNPADILASARTEEVLAALARHADLIIIDSPSSIAVSDAVILATRVDGVIQIVRAGRTRRDVVLKGKEHLTRVGARILGTVLNGAQPKDTSYGQEYYGHYASNRARGNKATVG